MEAFEDDDFGELYADFEAPNAIADFDRLYIQPEPEEEEEEEEEEQQQQQPDANSNRGKLNQEKLVSDRKNDIDDSVSAESIRSSVKELKDDCVGSEDSDDDLKIVLNDDDCADFPVGVAGCDDEDADADDHLADADESVAKMGVKGGYGSRFFHHKYMRTRGSMFVNNMKANKSMGMVSYCSSLNKGRWNADACAQQLALSSCHVTRMRAAGNPMVVQCGYGSFLPWYWSIFDVNIDTLNEKPWRVPGVDMTDYFNFDFNENTWKLYCASLEQLWRTSLQTGTPVAECAKLNQGAMREQIDQVESGSVLTPTSDYELPKGRAIQVEDSMVERQPSIDVRRPRSRDSDVIIQIKVLESSDDCSGSGNSILMDASLEGESIVGNNRNTINSSSERDDVLSGDHLEDVKKSDDSSVLERNVPVPGVDEDKHQDQVDQHSEDNAQGPGGEMNAEEGVGIDPCRADPCFIESELSLSDQELSLTSYPDSYSEATENSIHIDNEKSHSPLRRQSVDSVTDLKESLPFYAKKSKNGSFNRKPVQVAYYSRNRGLFRKELRHQSGRCQPGSYVNRHIENDNAVSSNRMSSARDLSLLGHQFVDYDRHKEQLQDFGSHKRRDVSHNRETKQTCYYGGEKFDDLVHTVHTKYSYWEDREWFRENTNRYDRRNLDERNYFFEPRSPMEHSEDRGRDWYHADWGYSADDLSPHSYGEPRQLFPKHSSFPAKERDTRRRRTNDKSHFGDRNCNDFDEFEFEFFNKSYRTTYSAEREIESLENKHEEQFPHIDRDWKRSCRRGRLCDRPPLVLDNLWSGKIEDKYSHHRTSTFRYSRQSYKDSVRNCVYGTRVNENFGDCRRHKNATDNRGSDWSCGYTDAAEDDDFMICPVENYQFYRSPPEVLNWNEDETICRRHETHAAPLHTTVQIDDIKLQQHQLNIPRRGMENCFKGSSKIVLRGKRGQAVLRGRKSVDLVNGEGKSHTRNSRVLCNGRHENVDQVITKKRRALVGFDKSHKVIKFNTPISGSNHENEKWLQNLPDIRQEASSDIEEGQIVTEGTSIEASVSRRDVSEGAAPTDRVKRRVLQNDNNSDQFIGGYDSQRILDSLAKMEKRRERFKQPITIKKEAEEGLKLNKNSIVDTGEIKQHRPARKRRWVGT